MFTSSCDRNFSDATPAGLQDNRCDFDSSKYGPAHRSSVLSGDPETDGGAEAKNCAGPSAGQRGRLAQYFQYSSHSITPWKRAMIWDCESTQIAARARNSYRVFGVDKKGR